MDWLSVIKLNIAFIYSYHCLNSNIIRNPLDIITHRNDLWEVNLRADDKPRGLIKAIIKRFGASLEHLQAVNGVTKVSLNLRNHVLSIQSTTGKTFTGTYRLRLKHVEYLVYSNALVS